MNRKILTLEDLGKFYAKQNKNINFSSKESGYQLAIQVPSRFEIEENTEDNSLFYGLIKCFHIGINRNHSSVTEDAAKKAMKTMAYKPILAGFTSWVDENGDTIEDFTSHDMEVDEDGNVVYLERQIGCFTADEPYIEHDDELNKDFVFARCAIPREYTSAVSIIERKGYTKVSVELIVNELSYNASEKVLELTDVVVQGLTCLGTNPETGQAVEEGMKGARLDIEDFSKSNNSMFSSISEEEHTKLIETLTKLNETLDKFNINKDSDESVENYGKEDKNLEGNKERIKKELMEEVIETEKVEEVTEETEVAETEVTETMGEEIVEETPEVVKTESEEVEEETEEEAEVSDDETVTEENACKPKKKRKCEVENMIRTYEISHEDIKHALYNLIASYEEIDNDYFYIEAVYDTSFAFSSWCTGNIFGQKYTKDGNNVTLDGERYALHRELLTDSEYAALNDMRANYAELEQFKKDTEFAQLHSQREAILADEKYSVLAEKETDAEGNEKFANEAYGKLVSEMDNYSLTDLEKEVKSIFADHVINKGQFSANVKEEKNTITKKVFASSDIKKPSRYGNLFSK